MSVNMCILEGRLTETPELKVTPNGIEVTTFTVAVDRDFKQGGEKQTDFINVVCWRQNAQFASKYFEKGYCIVVIGQLQQRKYKDKNGVEKSAFEVNANTIKFPESSKKHLSVCEALDKRNEQLEDDNQLPF